MTRPWEKTLKKLTEELVQDGFHIRVGSDRPIKRNEQGEVFEPPQFGPLVITIVATEKEK